uniref:Uncharacterized protein n=1 Tax=Meloidogyne incognita TaxID=6306 RepID=A0A914LJK4_MELIC
MGIEGVGLKVGKSFKCSLTIFKNFSRLTPRERTEIQSLASSSLYEINLSRGLPCAFATIAGLFLLKKRKIVNWSPITSGLIFGTVRN